MKAVPAGMLMVVFHTGYAPADRGMAADVFQEDSCEVEPSR